MLLLRNATLFELKVGDPVPREDDAALVQVQPTPAVWSLRAAFPVLAVLHRIIAIFKTRARINEIQKLQVCFSLCTKGRQTIMV